MDQIGTHTFLKLKYTLRVALASATVAELQVRVNDPKANPPLFSSGVIGKDNSIMVARIHGLYWLFNADVPGAQLVEGKNTVFLTQPQAHTSWQEIMYDYIRLEGPPSSGLKNIANEYFEWMKRKCLMESEQHTRSEQSCSPSRPSEVQYANEDTSHSPADSDMDMEDESQQPNEDLLKKQPWHMIVAAIPAGCAEKWTGPKNGEHYGAPLIEEEWDDNNVVFPKSEFDHDCTLDGFDEYVQAQQITRFTNPRLFDANKVKRLVSAHLCEKLDILMQSHSSTVQDRSFDL
ncbi:hypothetical protein IFM89_008063 [Coptis chinensis]|uniref:Rhamnogalacturonan lyase domain-containing protein n=1 Tax=Coptis chinensis TaxID=261450 RepID=A0A835IS66_9MAGN|nr:hypothetical protein IFM89_008063 [Coptis chinensis]